MKLSWDFSAFDKFAKRLVDVSSFDAFCIQATKAIARALHEMLFNQTPVKTGNLCAAWGGAENYAYTIKRLGDGYLITLINRGANDKGFQYGLAVNDGHKTPAGGWVVGRFFVENSIALTEPKVEQIIMRELQKWWRRV